MDRYARSGFLASRFLFGVIAALGVSAGAYAGFAGGKGYVEVTQPNAYLYPHSLGVTSDGKILLYADIFGNGANMLQPSVTRLNADGTVDTSFATAGTLVLSSGENASSFASMQVLPDGRVLLAGALQNAGDNDYYVVRLLPSGKFDPSFGNQGKVSVDLNFGSDDYAVALVPDGHNGYLIAGNTTTGNTTQLAIVRIDDSGNLDTDFGNGGVIMAPAIGPKDSASLIYQGSDGKLLVLGLTGDGTTSDLAAARFLPTGDLDTTFGKNGTTKVALGWMYSQLFAVGAQSDGRLVISGRNYSNNYYTMLLGLTPDGNPDTKFGTNGVLATGTGANYFGPTTVSFVQSDGTILVLDGGPEANYQHIDLSRYLATGSADATFGKNGNLDLQIGSTSFSEPCALVPYDKTHFLALNWTIGSTGYYAAQVALLNADGTIDTQP
jgi:uncharacterized delta-60 repeat protein